MMYRVYNVEKGLFRLKWGWTKTGRIWATRSGVIQHMRNRGYDVQDTNIQVWQYDDEGTRTIYPTIQAFLDHKTVKIKSVFTVRFVDGKMLQHTQWLDYYKRNGKTIVEMPSTEIVKDDLVLISTEMRSRGLGATFSDGTLHYVMLPKHFRKVIKKLNNGMLSGPFEFVNHSGYPGIKQIEKG